MEDRHRKCIIDNIERLIDRTDYEKLKHACTSINLLTDVMVQYVERVELPDTGKPWNKQSILKEYHRRLFRKITKRGPEAYDKLRKILYDLKFDKALSILPENDSFVSIRKDKQLLPNSTGLAANNAPPSPMTGNHSSSPIDNNTASNRNNNRDSGSGNGEDHRDGENNRRFSAVAPDKPVVLCEFQGEIMPKRLVNVKKSRRIQKHPSLDTYRMESKEHRGIFFMVNIIDFPLKDDRRLGAAQDAHSMLHLFKELGFKLFSYTNLTHAQFLHILDELLQSEYTKNTECFVMALMTHGSLEDSVQHVIFSDGACVKVNDIEQHFQHHVCANLVHKPKIFLFPFCRGRISDSGTLNRKTQTDSIGTNMNRVNNIPQLSDVIVCYATSEGFRSHRDTEDGSWYIQSFVQNMADKSHDTSFEDIIKMIQEDTSNLRTNEGHLQTGNFVNKGFNKVLYFNPGVWLE